MCAVSSSSADHVKLLRGAGTSILMDEGFTIPTKEASSCLDQARLFIRSLGRDRQGPQELHATFADWVVNLLSKIIDDSMSGGTIDREKLWGKFHCSRNAKDFKSKWMEYLTEVNITDPTPLFYQNVSQELFETLISQKCAAKQVISTEYIQRMTLEEENALRYVAGYVIRRVKDKLRLPIDQETLDILNLMVQEASSCNTSASTEDWVKSVNRGGLVLITEDAHQLFCAIEYCVQSQLHTSNMCSMDSTFRSRLTNSVLSDSEVQFRWACIGNVDEEAGEACLEMIVHKWITIRGFSFANSVMEQYKQENKKSTAKSKSLRTKLFE